MMLQKQFSELPVIIDDAETRLHGILRISGSSGVLIILLPFMAAGGTREGTQRLYVELSRSLLNDGISSFCVDLPPFSDSCDKSEIDYHPTSELYLFEGYLNKIILFLEKSYSFNEYILLSTSGGCIPVLNYSLQHKYRRVILLSPDEYLQDIKERTEYIAYSFTRMNNFIRYYDTLMNVVQKPVSLYESNKEVALAVLSIYGEKDKLLDSSLAFWRELLLCQPSITCCYEIIRESNHSFFGWPFKCEIIQHIRKWLEHD
jgi:hypothetical protein